MAKKNDGHSTSFEQYFSGTARYAAVTISKEEASAFLNWMSGVNMDFSDALQMIADEGYRVTFKRDFGNQSVMCTFTQQDDRHHNANLIIVSRSDDFLEAFWLTIYKVWVMYENQRLPDNQERALWG